MPSEVINMPILCVITDCPNKGPYKTVAKYREHIFDEHNSEDKDGCKLFLNEPEHLSFETLAGKCHNYNLFLSVGWSFEFAPH